jgi:hypothetical protein
MPHTIDPNSETMARIPTSAAALNEASAPCPLQHHQRMNEEGTPVEYNAKRNLRQERKQKPRVAGRTIEKGALAEGRAV